HRDLKPANVKITPDGTAKVLDFGLAKMVDDGQQEVSKLATYGANQTQEGIILGTVSYMSPEQARGMALDKETDIWSFGCVLFEMLSGRRPFQGETVSDIIAAILEREPDWNALPASVPARIRELLSRCLQKNARQRLRDAGDARIELEEFLRPSSTAAIAAPDPKRKIASFVIAAALLTILGFFLMQWYQKTQISSKNFIASENSSSPNPVLSQLTSSAGLEQFPALSPDGKKLAFSGESAGFKKIFVKDLQTGNETQVTKSSVDDIQPAWSSDGESLLFVRSNQPGGKLELGDVFGQYDDGDIWKLDPATGAEQKIVENAFNPSFSPDGKSIAVDASWAGPRRIWILNSFGSNPQQITTDVTEALSHIIPRWSPDGKKIVFQSMERTKFDIKTVDINSKKVESITDDLFTDINPVWAGNYIYFTSDRSGGWNVWRIPAFAKGPAQQLTTGAGQDVQLAVTNDGKQMALTILRQNADLWQLPVSSTSGDVTGTPFSKIVSTREDSRGAWSPDGKKIAFNSDRNGNMNVWLFTLADSSLLQLTKGPGGDFQPTWSPDETSLVFFSSRDGNPDIWIVNSNGKELKQLTKGDSMEINPFFSPDGKRIAYQSDQSGRLELWVMNSDGTNPHQISNTGIRGHFTRWSTGGDSIYYRNAAGKQPMMKISIKDGNLVTLDSVSGGSHMSLSPDHTMIMDVIGHKQMWASPLNGGKSKMIFQFEDPDVRIDYPVWSPDGKFILFDKFRPEGGDIWMMKNFE
ncbi:MAG TPA: protein kinase, partial [Acidobacteriota bacterium]|nr:protein kinase [Acidobacteriota bacterium]